MSVQIRTSLSLCSLKNRSIVPIYGKDTSPTEHDGNETALPHRTYDSVKLFPEATFVGSDPGFFFGGSESLSAPCVLGNKLLNILPYLEQQERNIQPISSQEHRDAIPPMLSRKINWSEGFPNMVLSTEYSDAVNARYTFQPLWVSVTMEWHPPHSSAPGLSSTSRRSSSSLSRCQGQNKTKYYTKI